ncbi:MAG TPA: hypothetical protein VJO54_15740 [Burkholderiales bacterium]|jgi:hypothetical protein|nr:hypothetical protein [Burkholderiales bacterium]
MWKRIGLIAVLAPIAAANVGCAPSATATTMPIEDKVYTVTPAAVKVKAGIVTGEVTEMKVTERVEKGSGRIESPAKLSGSLKLKNTSIDQTVRLIGGKIQYIDAQGKLIKLEENRTEPTLRFSTYGSSADRLDPGQDATQALDVDFPAEALKARKLKEIRLELVYLPSPYKEETANFTVSIGGQ